MKYFLLLSLLSTSFRAVSQQNLISKVVPHYVKLQYAGGTGYLSAAFGYESRNKKFDGDFIYGYVPKKYGGGETIHTIASKLTWFPLNTVDVGSLKLHPLSTGIWTSYTFGKQYFLFSPANYPYSYYNHPTAMHAGFFIGGHLKKNYSTCTTRGIGVYYELGTIDYELVSFASNKTIAFGDILNLALGVKVSL